MVEKNKKRAFLEDLAELLDRYKASIEVRKHGVLYQGDAIDGIDILLNSYMVDGRDVELPTITISVYEDFNSEDLHDLIKKETTDGQS